VDAVVSAARTVPMMVPRRFALLRGAERWDASDGETSPFDRLAEYAAAPVDTACLVVVATKLDGRRKFAQMRESRASSSSANRSTRAALPEWIASRLAGKGHEVERDVAELLAALAGPQLSSLDDAIERLSLYVGPGSRSDEAAVAPASRACERRIRGRSSTPWAPASLAAPSAPSPTVRYDPRERGLPLLGALAWSIRQLAALPGGPRERRVA